MPRPQRSVPALAALALATASLVAAPLAAQTPGPVQPLLIEGAPLVDGGSVTGVTWVDVNYFGDWGAAVTSDHPAHPEVLVRGPGTGPGAAWLAVGSTLQGMPGVTIAGFDAFSVELLTGTIWTGRLAGATPDADEGLFFEKKVWLREGQPIGDFVLSNMPPFTRWLSFDDVQASTANGVAMVRGRIDDPTFGGPSESVLALGYILGAPGLLGAMDRVVSQGELAPTIGRRIESVRSARAAAAISPDAARLVWAADLAGDPADDGVVYRTVQASGVHLVLAREGDDSPVPGRSWGPLEDIAVDIASTGQWTLRAALDGSDPSNDAVLVKNGQLLAREGDSPPAVAPDVVVGLGRGPALVGDTGVVVWYARLDGPGGPSEALFLDDQVLVRTGVTTIAGRRLVDLPGEADAISLSPLDDAIVFRGTLAGGVEGVFRIGLAP